MASDERGSESCIAKESIRPIREIRVTGSTGFFERVETVDALTLGDATIAVLRRAWTTIGPAVP
jgi:hypothetical protein